MTFSARWKVVVNGVPASDRMNPFVEEIECSGKSGGTADAARLTFDDEDGQCIFPEKNTPIQIFINDRLRFSGFTDEPESVVARDGGQQIVVSCSGFDRTGKAKQAQRSHKDDATLQEFLDGLAKKSGLSKITVDPQLGKIKRKYWSTRGASFLHLGQMLADEFGATFKIRGKEAVFAKRGTGTAPGGGSTPTITARRGDNLITCRIKPYSGRPRYTKARTRWYDRKKGKWEEKDVEIGGLPGGDVVDLVGGSRADADSAANASEGRKAASEREGGGGSLTMLLNVDAEAEGTCVVVGVRDGVDGPYRIEAWRDVIRRDGVAETELTLKQPQGSAGTDSRRKAAA